MRWRRDKLWEAAGCGRAAQHDEEKSVAPAQGGPKQRAISWHTAGLTAASCGGLSGSAGALQAAVGLCRARAFPLGQEVLGHSMAQGRWISGLQGTLQVFLSRHPTLLCPHEHPVLPTPSAPPPQSSASQMHSDSHTSSAPTPWPLPQHPGPSINCSSPDPQGHRGSHSLFPGSLLQRAMQRAFWMSLTAALELFEALHVRRPTAGCTVWGHSSPSCSRQSNKQHQAGSPVLPPSLEGG